MQNKSGIRPLDLKVLILPEKPKEKIGNIYVTDQHKDREKFAATRALLVATGANAFREWGGETPPKAGDTVLIAQYAGARQKGDDDEEYTVCNDEDIIAVLEAAQ